MLPPVHGVPAVPPAPTVIGYGVAPQTENDAPPPPATTA
jgi:hypothetical protein